MKFMELGKKENPVVLLLHGEGLSWWSVEETARLLQKKYRVVMPVLDGHGEDAGTDFISTADSARKLLRFIDHSCGGHVFAICGISLGAQTAAEVLAARPEAARYAVLENVLVQPGHSRSMQIPDFLFCIFQRLMRLRFFARLRANRLALPQELFESYFRDSNRISLRSLKNILDSERNFHIPVSLNQTKAGALVLIDSKESVERKLSAGLLKNAIPKSRLVAAHGMHCGELCTAHSKKYVALLQELFAESEVSQEDSF
ncbi:MAG: alpha/beta hydrolase [Oscillospiraceae bacterium]|jgi:pimeloyl-ACP methyl ester carboxylesterase|nr:alpha/beta hydrolase [Oscillospiraceae bacterium]